MLLPLLLVVLVGAGCDAESPLAPSAPAPKVPIVQSIAITGTTTLQRPGDAAQLTATITLSDRTTRDVSSEARWSVDHSDILAVNNGLLTGRAYGHCHVTVTYGSVSAEAPVHVMPDGTFMLSGRVTDQTGLPVRAARVSVTPFSPELSVLTNGEGRYTLPARGDVEVHAEMEGFETQIQRVIVSEDTNLDFELTLSAGGFGGTYRLTLVVAPSCGLPADVMQRNYLVRVTEHPAGVLSVVVLSPEMVAFGFPGFSGTRDGSHLQFAITDNVAADFVFIEVVDANRQLALVGHASGDIGDVFSTTFSGRVILRSSGGALDQCQADNHRLDFAR
jgi:hypothetical protein